MCPLTHISYLVLGVTTIISFVFGFLWYGPLFGKTWAQLMGKKMEDCKDKKPEASALLLTFLGTFLTTVILAFILQNTRSYCSFGVAFYVWLGFYVPLLFGTVTWEAKPWKLFALNAAFYFFNLQLIAAILTYWK